MKIRFLIWFMALPWLWIGCGNPNVETTGGIEQAKPAATVAALPQAILHPDDNPYSADKGLLGKALFYDPILSGGKDVSCATCHHPSRGYAEFLDLSIGPNGSGLGSKRAFNSPNDIPIMKRNSPTILNTAFNGIDSEQGYVPENAPMFWDSRAKSLEIQALEPIKTLEEMRGNHFGKSEILEVVTNRIKEIPEYQALFAKAFGADVPIDSITIGKAIAAFERTLIANNSRFDQYMRGDEDAISNSEKEGFALFKSAGCINCHNGPMFSDYKLHVLGVPDNTKLHEP